jgi:hypothetical protein
MRGVRPARFNKEMMIALLETLLLAAHLLCVNAAAGGPLVAAWLDWRARRGDNAAAKAASYLAWASLVGLLAGAALGITIGWLKWTAEYRALWLGPLSHKLYWAGPEAVFSLVLLAGWWLCLPGKAGGGFGAAATRGLVAVLASTNLLYHFPVLFSVADRLAVAGQTSGQPITADEFRRLMIEGETPALAIHVVLASLAVAGVVLLGLVLRWLRRGEEASATRLGMWAARVALLPTILQVPVGLWTLAMLPAGSQSRLMGETAVGTLLLLASLLAAFWLVNDLVRVSMGEVTRSLLVRVMTAMLVTVVLMTAMQREAKEKATNTSAVREAEPAMSTDLH